MQQLSKHAEMIGYIKLRQIIFSKNLKHFSPFLWFIVTHLVDQSFSINMHLAYLNQQGTIIFGM